jgi:hypothetical protein
VTDSKKTLGEVQLVNAAANLIFEEIASGVALQWANLWDQHRWLLAQYGEKGEVKFRKAAEPGETITVADPNNPEGASDIPAAQVNGQLVPAPNGVAFGTIPAEMLLAEVDIVPTGLKQLGDANARLQQATIVLNAILAHPLTMRNPEALLIALDFYLQAARFPQREKIMDEVRKQMAAQMAAQAQQAALEQQAAQATGANQGAAEANQANQADQAHQQQSALNHQQMAAGAQQAQAAAGPPTVPHL